MFDPQIKSAHSWFIQLGLYKVSMYISAKVVISVCLIGCTIITQKLEL